MFSHTLLGLEYRSCNLWGLLGPPLNFPPTHPPKEFNLYNSSIMHKPPYSTVFLVFSTMPFSFDFAIKVRWWQSVAVSMT